MQYIPPGPVCSAYIADRSRRSFILGPYGSGKSRGALIKLYLMALEQIPTDGIAKSRYIVSRLTRPQLTSTTVKTFQETFAELIKAGFQDVESAALRCTWKFRPEGYTYDVEIEWLFLALESEDDVARVLGLEATAFFIDEARLIPPALLGKFTGRLRYPAVSKHRSIEMASNPWSVDSPWHEAFVTNRNHDSVLFHQPGGLDQDAAGNYIGENLHNLNQTPESLLLHWSDPIRKKLGLEYYLNQLADNSPEDSLLNVHSRFGVSREGKPVYSDFDFNRHRMNLKYDPALRLEFGHDWGLSSATAIYQQTIEGHVRVICEFITEDQGDTAHLEKLKTFCAREFPGYRLGRFTGDPAGAQRGSDGQDKFALARKFFSTAQPANTNATEMRVDAVNTQFRRSIGKFPALTIDAKRCPMLIAGCNDKFFYKRLKGTGEQHSDTVEKNRWSHICEALAYAVLGTGAGRTSVLAGDLAGKEDNEFVKACDAGNKRRSGDTRYNPFTGNRGMHA